jgi:hypothetical protein
MSVDSATRDWLRQHGAEAIEHPGGTLYAHLNRVHDRLATLGCDRDTQLAGLVHAAYGTDGFAVTLLDWTDRTVLRGLVGAEVEALAYVYGCCDRKQTWRGLAATGVVIDRFTGQTCGLEPDQVRRLVDLSIVNELDVIEQDPAIAAAHSDYFRSVFTGWSAVASPSVDAAARHLLKF